MDKKFKHMGMEMTEAEHEKWHKEHPEMIQEEHQALMKKMQVNYPVLLGGTTDTSHVTSVIDGLDSFSGYPTSILIGRDGQVKDTEVGIKSETKERTAWSSRWFEKKIADGWRT